MIALLIVVALGTVLSAWALRAALVATRASGLRRRLAAALVPADTAVGRGIAPAAPGRAALGPAAPLGPGTPGGLPAPPAWLAPRLEAAGVEVAPAVAWWGGVGTGLVGAALGLAAGGLPLALVVTVAAAAGPLVGLRSRRGRGEERFEQGLPAALEAVARSLRSGASLRLAVAEAAERTPGPLGRELAAAAYRAARGTPMVEALEALAERHPLPGVRLAVAALCLGAETGGAQARAVDGVAATMRDRLGVAAEVRALSSQARVSAVVIGLAPLAFGAFAAATDPRTAQFMLHTPAGLGLLLAGAALDAAGWLWMQRLARVPL